MVYKKPPLAIKLTNGRRGHALTAASVVHGSHPCVARYPECDAKVRINSIIGDTFIQKKRGCPLFS